MLAYPSISQDPILSQFEKHRWENRAVPLEHIQVCLFLVFPRNLRMLIGPFTLRGARRISKAGGDRSGHFDTSTESSNCQSARTAAKLIVSRTGCWLSKVLLPTAICKRSGTQKRHSACSEASSAIPEQATSTSPPTKAGIKHQPSLLSVSNKMDIQTSVQKKRYSNQNITHETCEISHICAHSGIKCNEYTAKDCSSLRATKLFSPQAGESRALAPSSIVSRLAMGRLPASKPCPFEMQISSR